MIEHLTADRFDEQAARALRDETLRGALRHATDLFGERRRAAVAGAGDWEALRRRARAIKDAVLGDLDSWLLRFEAAATANGCVVHWARDAREACAIVVDLAARAAGGGAASVVKSKSMTTEEIGLNDALQRAGHDPVETDLGEWIVQLAGELPSHIIVPAIHKTKAQIAELFAARLGTPPTDDEAELTRTARRILRQRFADADLGISGVNFAVAETGAILVLENEGNIRLTTTLPAVHVAVMGIEKVIPTTADLAVFLQLLPRSGTGQHLTSYQSLLTRPAGPGRDGPRELHVVLLDNGRSALLRDAVSRQTLACIRCGACLNACPVYRQVGGHAYGSVYPGPIGAVLTPQLAGLHAAAKLPFASSLCGACRDVCPVRIDLPEVLLDLRRRIVAAKATRPRFGERAAFALWGRAMRSHAGYAFASALLRVARMLRADRGPVLRVLAAVVPPLRAWTSTRALRPLPRRSFRQDWPGRRTER